MTLFHVVFGSVALVILLYLFVALLYPERFS